MHVGTTVAVVWFHRTIVGGLIGLGADRRADATMGIGRWRWLVLLGAGSVPTALIGLGAEDAVRAAFEELGWVAGGLALTGGVLMLARLAPRPTATLDVPRALAIGAAQGLAIFPGVSRSGMTITAALLLGVPAPLAVSFSLLLSVPAIVGATLLDAVRMFTDVSAPPILFAQLAFATLSAGIVGYFCIGFVHRAAKADHWHRFAWYCWLVALILVVAAR